MYKRQLLYSPELKFYSNKVKMDENLDTNIKGLHCLGDSSGWTRGLMTVSYTHLTSRAGPLPCGPSSGRWPPTCPTGCGAT